MMEFEVLSEDKKTGKVSFLLKGVTPAFANTFRRVLADEVPTMAIEDVEFKQNSSILYDELVAHRLGLIALTTDLKGYELPPAGDEERSAKHECKFALSVKGPCTVYAEDMKSKDPKIKPVFPKTPIVKLLKGQELDFEATAILGRGKEHMKWSPGNVHYTYFPQITVKNDAKLLEEFAAKLPKAIFGKDGKIDRDLINTPQLVDAVEGVAPELVKVEYKPDEFVFHVEPWGQLSAKEMVGTALEVLKEEADEFVAGLK